MPGGRRSGPRGGAVPPPDADGAAAAPRLGARRSGGTSTTARAALMVVVGTALLFMLGSWASVSSPGTGSSGGGGGGGGGGTTPAQIVAEPRVAPPDTPAFPKCADVADPVQEEAECVHDCCSALDAGTPWPRPERPLHVAMLGVHAMMEQQFQSYFEKQGHVVGIMNDCDRQPEPCMEKYPAMMEGADVIVVDTNHARVNEWREFFPRKVLLGGIHGHHKFGRWAPSRYPTLDGVLLKRCCDSRFIGDTPYLVVPYTMDFLADRVQREWTEQPQSPDINSYVNDYSKRFPDQCKQFQKIEAAVPHVVRYDTEVGRYGEDIASMIKSRYTLHLKGDGYLCNAVGRSLAVGIPVIMDKKTFLMGLYQGTGVIHGVNAFVGEDEDDIIRYLVSTLLLLLLVWCCLLFLTSDCVQQTVTDEEYMRLRLSTREYASHRFLNSSFVPGSLDLEAVVARRRAAP